MSVVTNTLETPVTVRGNAVVTLEQSQDLRGRTKTVGVASVTTIDLRGAHTLICCIRPQKSVSVIDGTYLKLEFRACHACVRCVEHTLPQVDIID